MGYYAKDGSYVRDDSDIKFAETRTETQGQAFDRAQRVIAQAEAYEEQEKRAKEAERQMIADMRYESFQAENRRAVEARREAEAKLERERKQRYMRQYGVDYDMRNPENLDDRRRRANYWRINNNFTLLVDTVIGKNQRFGKLWDAYSAAQTEEERQKIVEKMERLYPTRELAVRGVEKKTGYRR